MRKLQRQDLLDILYGCTILGTGGGGSLEEGIKKIDEALALDKEFILVDFDELDDEDLIATPYSVGQYHQKQKKREKNMRACQFHRKHPMLLHYEKWKNIWAKR